MRPARVPDATFHTRVPDETAGGANPFTWKEITSAEVFGGRDVVLFAVPGAFTPACSEVHLPGYEAEHAAFMELGIDEVCCLAVNDAFVMRQWAQFLGIRHVRMLPDGNGDFTRQMGMLVRREAQGMGLRSWRYAMHVCDGAIRRMFVEVDFRDNPEGVPVGISDAWTMLDYLRNR